MGTRENTSKDGEGTEENGGDIDILDLITILIKGWLARIMSHGDDGGSGDDKSEQSVRRWKTRLEVSTDEYWTIIDDKDLIKNDIENNSDDIGGAEKENRSIDTI